MKKKASLIILGLSLLVILSAFNVSARGSSSASSASVRSSSSGSRSVARATTWGGSSRSGFRGSSPSVRYGGGLAKSAATGNTSGWSGHRGSSNYYHSGYNHRHYRGYYGWGPYWSVGAYFNYIPDYYTTVYVDGSPYYYCDGSYFQPYSDGYMVVPPPTATPSEDQEAPAGAPSVEQPVAALPKSASSDTATINVPTSKGGFTPVRLVKHKNGYIGPQGEFYTGHPTVAALKALYGD